MTVTMRYNMSRDSSSNKDVAAVQGLFFRSLGMCLELESEKHSRASGLADRLLKLQQAVLRILQLTMLKMTISIASLLLSIHCLLLAPHQSLLQLRLLQHSNHFPHLLPTKVKLRHIHAVCNVHLQIARPVGTCSYAHSGSHRSAGTAAESCSQQIPCW